MGNFVDALRMELVLWYVIDKVLYIFMNGKIWKVGEMGEEWLRLYFYSVYMLVVCDREEEKTKFFFCRWFEDWEGGSFE